MDNLETDYTDVLNAMRQVGIDAKSPLHDLILPGKPLPQVVKLDLTAVDPDQVRDAVFIQILNAGFAAGERHKAAVIRRELDV